MVKSEYIDNDYGVPQGSVLGALLFIICIPINGMPKVIEEYETILYADEARIFTERE